MFRELRKKATYDSFSPFSSAAWPPGRFAAFSIHMPIYR